ncbi:glycosyltransferase family 9 protein [Candidatus Omnitrophota bacterium]
MDKSKISRILIVNLSNIGDAVLTTPVVQSLRDNFPHAHLAVLVGPRAFGVFKSDRRINQKIIYDKSITWKNKLALTNRLRHDNYDLVVDLRESFFSILLGSRYRTSVILKPPKSLLHMKDRHLWKVSSLGLTVDNTQGPSVELGAEEQLNVSKLLKKWQVKNNQVLIALAPGARNKTKRWEKQAYAQLIEKLKGSYNARIINVGDSDDRPLVEEIISSIRPQPINACGRTEIGELAYLLTKCKLLISNDSAPMHLAWAVGTPVVSIFGPTDDRKYGPRGPKDVVIRKILDCAPCGKSLCFKGTRDCMKLINVDQVFAACQKILG